MASRKSEGRVGDMGAVSGKWPVSASLAIGAGFIVLLLVALILILRPAPDTPERYDIGLHPFMTEAGLEVGYRPQEPITEMVLPLPPDLLPSLSVVMGAETISLSAHRDGILVRGSEPWDLVTIVIGRDIEAPAKDYPVVQYGTRDGVMDASRWQPVEVDGNRVGLAPGRPRFQWVGEPRIWAGEGIVMLYEPALPEAIQAMTGNSVAVLNDYYAEVLGNGPATAQLMMLYAAGEPGQLSIEGDTVPGQSLIRFVGQGFTAVGPEAQRRTRQNIAHELAHQWQLARGGTGASPDWLHEGGAEALALESLFVTELYEESDYALMLDTARDDCAAAVRMGPLVEAAENGRHIASYACGVMAWTALSVQREGATVAQTWLAFTDFAEDRRDGLSADAFYAFAAEWAGRESYESVMRRFITADWSATNGTVPIDALFAGEL